MKRNLYLMYAIALLQGMVFYGPIATLYRQARGLSVFEITLIESISLGLCILLELPWGVVADRIGYRNTMVFCCWLYFASKLVFWQAEGFGAFLAERVLLSVVTAGLSGVDESILWLSCKGEGGQRAFGVYNALGMAGLLFAAAVFTLWVGEDQQLAALLTVASYGLAAVLALALVQVRPAAPPSAEKGRVAAALGSVLADRPLVLFLVGAALLGETHQTLTVFLNQPQYVRCGMGAGAIGWAYLAASALGLGGALSAAVTAKLGTRRALALLGGAALAACLALAFTRSAPVSVAAILTLRGSNTLFQPLQMELQNRRVRTADRATALSACAVLSGAVAVGTNLAFGALAQLALPLAFVLGACLCAAGLLLFAAGRGVWER